MTDGPLSVLHVIERLGRGGAERHVLDLSAALTARGHRTHVLARAGGLTDPARTDLTVVAQGRRLAGWRGPIDSACERDDVDVIHVHSVMPLPAALAVGRRRRIPVVFTVHGWEPSSLSWRTLLLRAFRPALVVVVSADLAADLTRRGLPSRVVPNGVPDANPDPVPPVSSDPPLLLSVGRLEAQKNHEALARAVAMLRDQGVALRVVILGEGSLAGAVRSTVTSLGLDDVVSMPGFEDPTPWYRQATAVVSASLWEGLSLAYVEALMWGLPLVITPTSGSAAVVEGGKNGVVVADPSPPAIAAGIREVLDGDLAGMGRAGRDLFERSFTHDAMVDRLLECYALARRRRG